MESKEAYVNFTCGHCQQKLKIEEKYEGQQVECPACHKAIFVPELITKEPTSREELVEPCLKCGNTEDVLELPGHRLYCSKCRKRIANRRLLAFLIDYFVIYILCYIVIFTLVKTESLVVLYTPYIPLFYMLLKDALFAGQSIGKKVLGIQVIDVSNGAACSYLESFKRNLPIFFVPFALLFGTADILKKKIQRFGEGWANTVVVFWKQQEEQTVIRCTNKNCGRKLRIPKLAGILDVSCPSCGTHFKFQYGGDSERKPNWLFSRLVVILSLILYYQVGLVLLWLSSRFQKPFKVLITIILVLLLWGSAVENSYREAEFLTKPTLQIAYDMIREKKTTIYLPNCTQPLKNIPVFIGQASKKLTKQQISTIADPAVSRITTERNGGEAFAGSGFNISPIGLIVTNYHVLAGAKKATVVLQDKTYENVQLVHSNSERDLAILAINGQDLPYAVLGDSNLVEKGEEVVAIGHPVNVPKYMTPGIISLITDQEGFKLFGTSAPISPGSSGGPLLNMFGEVIGVTTASIFGAQNVNFAVPIEYVEKMLEEKGVVNFAYYSSVDGEPNVSEEMSSISSETLMEFVSTDYGFELSTPSVEWDMYRKGDSRIMSGMEDVEVELANPDMYSYVFVFSEDANGYTIRSYKNICIALLKKENTGLEVVEKEIIVSGIPAIEARYSIRVEGVDYIFSSVYLVYGRYAFRIISFTWEPMFSQAEKDLKKILASFKISQVESMRTEQNLFKGTIEKEKDIEIDFQQDKKIEALLDEWYQGLSVETREKIDKKTFTILLSSQVGFDVKKASYPQLYKKYFMYLENSQELEKALMDGNCQAGTF